MGKMPVSFGNIANIAFKDQITPEGGESNNKRAEKGGEIEMK